MAAGDVSAAITSPRAFTGALFDGVDDYVDIAHHYSQIGTGLIDGLTISVFVNPKSLGESNEGAILSKCTAGLDSNGFGLRMRSPMHVLFQINGALSKISADNSVPLNTWTHVLVTISNGNPSTVIIYINGVQSGTQGNSTALSAITATNPVRIGNNGTSTIRTFDGCIRNVKIWNRVLTAAEIAADYAGIDLIKDGLILDVPLKENYDDRSVYALSGTNSGTSFATIEQDVKDVIQSQRTTATATGKYNITIAGGQVISTAITD